MGRDTGKMNWIRGPPGSPHNSVGVERKQDTGSRTGLGRDDSEGGARRKAEQ